MTSGVCRLPLLVKSALATTIDFHFGMPTKLTDEEKGSEDENLSRPPLLELTDHICMHLKKAEESASIDYRLTPRPVRPQESSSKLGRRTLGTVVRLARARELWWKEGERMPGLKEQGHVTRLSSDPTGMHEVHGNLLR